MRAPVQARRQTSATIVGELSELERGPELAQLEPVDEFHDDDGPAGYVSDLEHLDDARVGKERQRLGLRRNALRGTRPGLPQKLRRHDAIQLQVVNLVNVAHAAGAKPLDDAEAVNDRKFVARGRFSRYVNALLESALHVEVLLKETKHGGRQSGRSRETSSGAGTAPLARCCSMSSASRSRASGVFMMLATIAASARPSPGQTPCGRRPGSCRVRADLDER